jgi:AcrR family transcriptional regulator
VDPSDDSEPRPRLTRERVLQAAVGLADRDGLDALTMRRLGAELGVEAMSLYKHVANKDEILGGILALVVGEIELPSEGSDWKDAMRRRATSARSVLRQHAWAIGLLESRASTEPASLRYVNAILGTLRSAGFSIDDAVHAFWVLDSFVYGHVVQETGFSVATPEDVSESASAILERVTPDDYPYLVEAGERAMTPGYGLDEEFAFGLELILDALERSASPTG